MESGTRGETMNPRACIDTRLELIQEDLDGVERRLGMIIKELLGSQPIPDNRLRKEEKNEVVGWLNQVVSKLDHFRGQLGRIKELETDLKKSIIGSSERILEEPKKPTEE